MATEIVTDPLRTILFKFELTVLIFSTVHTSYFTYVLLKLKTFPVNLIILCLYLGISIYGNIVTRIWIIIAYLWVPEPLESISKVQALHVGFLTYFEINIICIILERVIFILTVNKRIKISSTVKAIVCCIFTVSYWILRIHGNHFSDCLSLIIHISFLH